MERLLGLLLISTIGACTAASTAAVSPTQAVARAKAEWLRDLKASAKSGDRAATFPSPSRIVLMRRLRRAEKLYGFSVASVRILHPLESAPVIVIRSDHKLAIAHATATIVDLFDPRHVTSANPSGYAYEGYFFVARTGSGSPYLAAFNHVRAPNIGSGEWAASGNLYPFAHW